MKGFTNVNCTLGGIKILTEKAGQNGNAIILTRIKSGILKKGDLIEIQNGNSKVTLEVSNIQVDFRNIEVAYAGNNVGIELDGITAHQLVDDLS